MGGPLDRRRVGLTGPGERPGGQRPERRLPALGRVRHEAADVEPLTKAVQEAFSAAGIRVVALKIDRIEQFFRAARILGAAAGVADRAAATVDSVTGAPPSRMWTWP